MDLSSYCNSLDSWLNEQKKFIRQQHESGLQTIHNRLASEAATHKYYAEMQKLATPELVQPTEAEQTTPTRDQPRIQYYRFGVPTVQRRIIAEIIDFVVVCLIKTLFLVFFKSPSKSHIYNFVLMDLLSAIPGFRFVSRTFSMTNFSVTFFDLFHMLGNFKEETYFDDVEVLLRSDQILGIFIRWGIEALLTAYSLFDRSNGSATIGKWLMNLRIVTCSDIVAFPNDVEIVPATSPGFMRALGRVAFKHCSYYTFLSLLMTVMFFGHRNTYDLLVGTAVVSNIPVGRPQQEDNAAEEQQ